MKAIQAHAHQGLDGLTLVHLPDPGEPGPGAIRVRVRATSLNFHDLGVVTGRLSSVDGRIPMADGAGVVEAVGSGVTEFKPGDHVVSIFFPTWLDDDAPLANFATAPDDGIDGFAREVVMAPATSFTRTLAGWSHAAAATLTHGRCDGLAGLGGQRRAKGRRKRAGPGHGRRVDLRVADRAGAGSRGDRDLLHRGEAGAAARDERCSRRRLRPGGALGRPGAGPDGRKGVDYVVEVGGRSTLAQSINAARVGGHISLIGVLTGMAGEVPTAMLMARQQRLQGLIVGSRRHQLDPIRGLEAVYSLRVIDRSFTLAEIADAFRLQESPSHFGKVVVEY